jgi:UDP-N-acetylglucosamine--N-acetylmuramyl-(pentapeptide) pyrophosphoryl-undecaprenol N-acetylglucosamine transferase
MGDKRFFFAGGGTGGHIYPAVAVAEKISRLEPTARIHFFCSPRSIDARILKQTGFEYTMLPAKGFSVRLGKLIGFCSSFVKSYAIAREAIADSKNAVVTGLGGFVAGPVCLAAHRRKVPIAVLNVDIVPGRANKIIGRWAEEIFVQFEDTGRYFARSGAKVNVVGCPLRSGFSNPEPNRAIEQLGLDRGKKILLITGASSGSENINAAVCSLLEKLDAFADYWQVVHLAGVGNYEKVKGRCANAKISYKVAEYAAASVPSICMPYPYHRDRHQYLNAGKLAEAGAAVIVDDLPDERKRAERLWEQLEELMKDEEKRQQMAKRCNEIANLQADSRIAEKLLRIGG